MWEGCDFHKNFIQSMQQKTTTLRNDLKFTADGWFLISRRFDPKSYSAMNYYYNRTNVIFILQEGKTRRIVKKLFSHEGKVVEKSYFNE